MLSARTVSTELYWVGFHCYCYISTEGVRFSITSTSPVESLSLPLTHFLLASIKLWSPSSGTFHLTAGWSHLLLSSSDWVEFKTGVKHTAKKAFQLTRKNKRMKITCPHAIQFPLLPVLPSFLSLYFLQNREWLVMSRAKQRMPPSIPLQSSFPSFHALLCVMNSTTDTADLSYCHRGREGRQTVECPGTRHSATLPRAFRTAPPPSLSPCLFSWSMQCPHGPLYPFLSYLYRPKPTLAIRAATKWPSGVITQKPLTSYKQGKLWLQLSWLTSSSGLLLCWITPCVPIRYEANYSVVERALWSKITVLTWAKIHRFTWLIPLSNTFLFCFWKWGISHLSLSIYTLSCHSERLFHVTWSLCLVTYRPKIINLQY